MKTLKFFLNISLLASSLLFVACGSKSNNPKSNRTSINQISTADEKKTDVIVQDVKETVSSSQPLSIMNSPARKFSISATVQCGEIVDKQEIKNIELDNPSSSNYFVSDRFTLYNNNSDCSIQIDNVQLDGSVYGSTTQKDSALKESSSQKLVLSVKRGNKQIYSINAPSAVYADSYSKKILLSYTSQEFGQIFFNITSIK